jgi:DNA-binding transcriptional ArsR family regulator
MIDTQMSALQHLDDALLMRAAHVYRVLSHPTRLRVVDLLMTEQLAVGELAERLELAPATLSQHLNLLRTNGVVKGERKGTRVFYKVVSPLAHAMITCLQKHGECI